MGNSTIGVLDLGTNSFHILIAKVENKELQIIYKDKEYVKLASDGIAKISKKKIAKALQVLSGFKAVLESHKVDCIKINATEGLRKASNAAEFIALIEDELGLSIEVIDGNREAELIYKGVAKAVQLNGANSLIIDIGGGSTECIIANANGIKWKQSFPLGAAVLKNRVNRSNQLTNAEYNDIVSFIETTLDPFWEAIKTHEVENIIGASGSFDTVVNMLRGNSQIYPYIEQTTAIINLSGFRVIHLECLRTNLEDRLALPGMEAQRAEMMPFATTLISVIINRIQPKRSITASSFAMKEGLLLEAMEELLTTNHI